MKKNICTMNKENQQPFITPKQTSKFGNKIKNRVSNFKITQQTSSISDINNTPSDSNSFLDMSESLIFDKRPSQEVTEDEKNLVCLKIDLKRNKSVRFNESPLDAPPSIQRKNSSRTLVPILKNSRERSSGMMSPMEQSAIKNSSFTSHVGSQKSILSPMGSILQDKNQPHNNKNKYNNILEGLKKNRKKYFDELFPPGASAVYFNPKDNKFGDVRWNRISELFKNKTLSLFNDNPADKCLIVPGQVKIPYMVTCFSSIRNSNRTLERIFQNQKVNEFGIYYLRIFQEGIWKYVVVDDYIPIVYRDKRAQPLFLNIIEQSKKPVEIWPFLLQKAYAKIYSTYQSLIGPTIIEDFMNQISGGMVEVIQNKKQNSQYQLNKHFNNHQSLVLVGDAKQNIFFPAVKKNQYNFNSFSFTQQISIFVENPLKQTHQVTKYPLFEIPHHFKQSIVCKLNECYYAVGSVIKQGSKDSYSIRQFTVDIAASCDISLIQKDKKFFRNTGYEYSWARLMIVMKQKNGYRWINGAFSRRKFIQLSCLLDPGVYYAIVMVDWGKRIYDINLNYNGNFPISFTRKAISDFPNILEQSCIDLAQRFGDFRQLSANLCAYRYVDYFNRLIIENINNENSKKEVAIIKSYEKAMKEHGNRLICLNLDFVKNKHVISVKIKPKQNYTLILKVKGDDDMGFMDHFIFDE